MAPEPHLKLSYRHEIFLSYFYTQPHTKIIGPTSISKKFNPDAPYREVEVPGLCSHGAFDKSWR